MWWCPLSIARLPSVSWALIALSVCSQHHAFLPQFVCVTFLSYSTNPSLTGIGIFSLHSLVSIAFKPVSTVSRIVWFVHLNI